MYITKARTMGCPPTRCTPGATTNVASATKIFTPSGGGLAPSPAARLACERNGRRQAGSVREGGRGDDAVRRRIATHLHAKKLGSGHEIEWQAWSSVQVGRLRLEVVGPKICERRERPPEKRAHAHCPRGSTQRVRARAPRPLSRSRWR